MHVLSRFHLLTISRCTWRPFWGMYHPKWFNALPLSLMHATLFAVLTSTKAISPNYKWPLGSFMNIERYFVLRPRAYLMCHAFICNYILLYTSRVLLMCTTGPPYRLYRTSPLSRYLAALDLLTRHGSPAYLGHTSHARAAPLTHTHLHCFWHAWVISTAMTPISFAAYSVRYCASVSSFLAFWRVFSACYDSYFTWLLVTRSYLYI